MPAIQSIKAIKYVLCKSKNHPVWACDSIDMAIGIFAERHDDVILNETSRRRIFQKLTREGWSIRRAKATVLIFEQQIKEC